MRKLKAQLRGDPIIPNWHTMQSAFFSLKKYAIKKYESCSPKSGTQFRFVAIFASLAQNFYLIYLCYAKNKKNIGHCPARKNIKKILTMLLVLVMTFALNSCGDAGPSPANSSASASTSAVETEPHEYTVYDLDGLITGIGDVAVIQGSTVNLLALVSYDDTVVTDVALDTGLLDFDAECQVTVIYTIAADTAALAQHLGLEIEEGAEQSLSFEVAKRVYVIAEDGVAEFQAKHPEVPVYTNDNVLYAPAEIPQAEVTAAPEEPAVSDTNNSASDNQNQTANKPASNNSDNNSTSNNDSSNSATNQGASNAGAGNNKPSGTDTTNTNNGSNHNNTGLNGSSGSNSGNGSAGSNSGSSGNNTGNTGTGSSGNNTGNTGNGSSGNSGSGTANKPTHTHSYSSKVTKAATCSTAGTRTYTCSCGDTYTESIPATGNHTWIEVTTTVNHEESGHWETKTVSEA